MIMFVDEGDEAATQRYEDDDQTPDMAEIEKDDNLNVPVVDTEPSRGRSPLKSALASPKKQKSPSPKKVQFVSQNSETSSESGEPSRRSKRRNKGVQKEVETTVAESETKNLAKVSVAAPLAGNKRSTRGKQATSKKDVKDEKEKSETVGDSNETEKSEICTDTGSHHTNDLSTEKESGLTTKSTRSRGRKSVDTGINVKQGKVSRKTRTSLPAVLEESKPETIQQVDNSEDENVVTDGKQNVTESKEKVKKNIKGKGKQSQVVKSENLSIESEETAADTLQNSEPSEKRSNRSTRTNVSVSKTRNVEETQSDTTNNESGKSEDNTTTRSHRNGRRRVVDDADKMDNQVKKRKVDQVIAEGDKREESPETSSRTRTSRNKVSDKVSSDTKLVETESVNSKSKGKNRKSHTANAVISENNDSNSDGVKSDSVTDEMAITDDQQKVKGKGVRSKRGKDDKDDSETVKNNVKKEHIEDVVVGNKK
ncbi:suppressor of Mek1-like [Ruditapes philippinarum]|uniref:suppressor of Mek1-like n=1 Tax=Ruditapes philippinarum TaxID=129788 RepID=UPI00295B40E0|nr:suppressor of Mek1-like [Ruditapes philippinarum]